MHLIKLENWNSITTLIVDDSMTPDIEQRGIPNTDRSIKVKYFHRETSDGMHYCMNTSIHFKNPEDTIRIKFPFVRCL